MAAWAPLIRPPFPEVFEGFEGDVHPHVRGAGLKHVGDLGRRATLGRQLHAHHGQDPLGHRGAERIDDVDLAIGQQVAGDLCALDRAGQGAGNVDRDDRARAGREGRLVGILELARRGGCRRGERRVRRNHPVPERGGRQLDAGLEALSSEAHQQRDDSNPKVRRDIGVEVRSGIGDDRDASQALLLMAGPRTLRA